MDKKLLKPEIKSSIEKSLGVSDFAITPLEGGTNNRTFFASTIKGEYVIRIEEGNGVQLRRAYSAQMRAQGLGVPVAAVVANNFDEVGTQDWIIEQKIEGSAFYPDQMPDEDAKATSYNLGIHLKKLNSVETDVFGLLPPFPYKSHNHWKEKNIEEFEEETKRNGLPHSSFPEHIDSYASRVESIFEIADLDKRYLGKVKDVYEQLKKLYTGNPYFAAGDTATTNLIVKDGKIQAIIDWEWAQGSDPAENVAYWHYWNKDPKYLDYFLDGYEPENREVFKERIDLYQITTAIHLIGIFKEMGNARWIDGTKKKLEVLLESKK